MKAQKPQSLFALIQSSNLNSHGRTALALGAVCLLFQAAQAQLFYQDGFNYTPGTSLAGNGGWANSYSYITVGNDALTYPGLTSAPGTSAAIAQNNTPGSATTPFYSYNEFSSPGITAASSGSGLLYVSFLLDYTSLTPSANYTFLGLLPSGSLPGSPWSFTAANDYFDLAEKANSTGTAYQLGIRNHGGNAVAVGPMLSINTAHLVVMKYNLNTGGAYLYIDPTELGGVDPNDYLGSSVGGAPAANLGEIFFRAAGNQSAGGGVASPGYEIGSFRVGATWADVTPVPEPATGALLGLGLLAFGLPRWMRRRQ